VGVREFKECLAGWLGMVLREARVPVEATLQELKTEGKAVYSLSRIETAGKVRIRATLDFIRRHKNVIYYKLLPYMRFGVSGYGFLGRVSEMQDFEPLTEEKLAALRAIIDEAFGRQAGRS
jgi:pyruvate-formate lyase-activating enzyme